MKPDRIAACGLIATLFASTLGCTLAPAYQTPAAPVAANWPGAPEVAGSPNAPWQDYYTEPRVQKLIALALANNRDLRVTALNIEKARALYGIQSAALLPAISAGADASGTGAGGAGGTTHQYSVGVGFAAYELDLFGKVRSLKTQALEQYLSTEQAHQTQQISLVAETATAYLTLAADQQLLRLAQDTLLSQQASLNLVEQRRRNGVASGLDLYDAQTSTEAARSDVAIYSSRVAVDINALTLVVGTGIPLTLLPPADSLVGSARLADLAAGTPSSALQNRPDIQSAEHILRGANANIGAARAAFFPSITLTAAAGTASPNLAGLFKGGSGAWNFAPSITLPIFDGGLNQSSLDASVADRDIALAQYEKTIQTAFQEIADVLAQRSNLAHQEQAQQALTTAASKRYRTYEARYKTGTDTSLNVLIAQRSLYTAQQTLITTQLSQQLNKIALRKALGYL